MKKHRLKAWEKREITNLITFMDEIAKETFKHRRTFGQVALKQDLAQKDLGGLNAALQFAATMGNKAINETVERLREKFDLPDYGKVGKKK